jgi:hypothetical protein
VSPPPARPAASSSRSPCSRRKPQQRARRRAPHALAQRDDGVVEPAYRAQRLTELERRIVIRRIERQGRREAVDRALGRTDRRLGQAELGQGDRRVGERGDRALELGVRRRRLSCGEQRLAEPQPHARALGRERPSGFERGQRGGGRLTAPARFGERQMKVRIAGERRRDRLEQVARRRERAAHHLHEAEQPARRRIVG